MYIEHLIDRLANGGIYMFSPVIPISKQDITIVNSMSSQVERDIGYTEKQRRLSLNFVGKYQSVLTDVLKMDIAEILLNPTFKFPVRSLQYEKKISIVQINNSKVIKVQFPYNSNIVNSFQLYKTTCIDFIRSEIAWNGEQSAWLFGFNEPNILFLSNLLLNDFSCDDEFALLASETVIIQDNLDQHIPMIVYNDGKFLYKNAVSSIPQPTSSNVEEVLLIAKRHGITCWDDNIDRLLESKEVNNTVKLVISKTSCDPIILPTHNLLDIKDIIQYSHNILFVIPGGSELQYLSKTHAFLSTLCYTNSQLAVMFRLDNSETGKLYNDYVKKHNINNVITDDIKFVFISGKIPKPLIASSKKFDAVIHFGTNSAHYTLKNYIRTHHNVISMSIQDTEQELNFGKL